jgi:hypothetical protein
MTQRGVEPDGVQRPFDVVGIVALFEQRERDPSRPPPRFGEGCLGELLLGPLGVRALQVTRETPQVPRVHRRDVAAHGHRVGHRILAREVELREAPKRAHDR